MFRFLQKYQKLFFSIVTFAIVASFALFGVLDLFERGAMSVQEDREVGKLYDGSSLMNLELKNLARFISTDPEDLMFRVDTPVNLCNNGVIRRDFLFTGIADLIVNEYFDQFREDLAEKLKKAKQYRPYINLEAPRISARSIWEKYLPAITEGLDSLKEQSEVSLETFTILSNLYLQQSACPPELTRRFLSFHESQEGTKDPYLLSTDLALFGYHSASEWFGSSFVEKVAEFILNGARVAEKNGVKVLLDEAKADLERIFEASKAKIPEKLRGTLSFSSHLRLLGFNETDAAKTWRKVLLFRRNFENASQGMIIDQLPYKDFASFSRDSNSIHKYEWPPEMHLKTAKDLIEFQVYLKCIGGKLTGNDLPSKFLPLKSIQENTPELVHAKYRAKMAKATLKEVGLQMKAKEVLDFQLEASNWEMLCSKFPFLKVKNTHQERLELLDSLSKDNRDLVDQFVRMSWAKTNSYAVQNYLNLKKREELEISISEAWGSIPELKNPKKLFELFDSGLSAFEFQDGETFYRFENIEKIAPTHVLTFKEARSLGVLERLSNKILESEYKQIRESYPSLFQAKEGEWKAFYSVKEKIAAIVMDRTSESLSYHAKHRLEVPTKKARDAIEKDSSDASWLVSSANDPLLNQFKLNKLEMQVPKMAEDAWMKETIIKMQPGMFSPISVPDGGNISFFYLEKRCPANEPILEQLTLGKEILGADAKRYLALKLLQKMKKENP